MFRAFLFCTNQSENMSYITIPEQVERSEFLCPMSKLLFGRIQCLSKKQGYCWASNQYFAEWYNCSQSQVTRWVSELSRAGFIECEIIKKSNTRRIAILQKAVSKNADTSPQKCTEPISENAGTYQQKCVVKNSINEYDNKEKYIQPAPQQVEGIYIFFNDFEQACADYFDAKCAVRNTKKSDSLEMCYIHLINNALAGSDIGKLDTKTIKSYNPDENEKNAVKSEIKKFLDGLEFYKLEKSRFEQGSTGFYAPKLIKSILIKNEYSKTVKENAGGVTPKNENLDWRVSFLPKLQKINAELTAKNLDYLLSASRICLGMIIHQDNKALIRASIGEFVQNNLDKNLPALSQKEVKELYKNWIGQTETGRAFAIHAKQKQPVFLQEMAATSR
jgi:hypothetical protein